MVTEDLKYLGGNLIDLIPSVTSISKCCSSKCTILLLTSYGGVSTL